MFSRLIPPHTKRPWRSHLNKQKRKGTHLALMHMEHVGEVPTQGGGLSSFSFGTMHDAHKLEAILQVRMTAAEIWNRQLVESTQAS